MSNPRVQIHIHLWAINVWMHWDINRPLKLQVISLTMGKMYTQSFKSNGKKNKFEKKILIICSQSENNLIANRKYTSCNNRLWGKYM